MEANGKFYYVLLPGTCETLTDANAAAASRLESLMMTVPWIRKPGSQTTEAMMMERVRAAAMIPGVVAEECATSQTVSPRVQRQYH